MRALSFSSHSWFGLVLGATALSSMGCGSSVAIDDAKGTATSGTTTTASTTGAGGTGAGGSTSTTLSTSGGSGGAGGSASSTTDSTVTSSTTDTTVTSTFASACDEVCAKVQNECNQGDLCGQYGLDCGNPQYECPSSCAAGADCNEIQLLLEAVGTQDWQALQKLSPATQSCLMGCWNNTGTGSTGTWTGTGTKTGTGSGDPTCGQCAYQSCPISGCGQDQACKSWRQCTLNCSNQSPACFTACNDKFPGAASKYDPFYACMCTSCDSECGATMDPCQQGGAGGGTGGAGSGTGGVGGIGGAPSSSTN